MKLPARISIGYGPIIVTEGDLQVFVYICSHCDKTHLSITLPCLRGTVQIDLEPQQAKTLGQKLIYPQTDEKEFAE